MPAWSCRSRTRENGRKAVRWVKDRHLRSQGARKASELRVESCVNCSDMTRRSSLYWIMGLVTKHKKENTQLQWKLGLDKIGGRSEAVKADAGAAQHVRRECWGGGAGWRWHLLWGQGLEEEEVPGELSHPKRWWGWIGPTRRKSQSAVWAQTGTVSLERTSFLCVGHAAHKKEWSVTAKAWLLGLTSVSRRGTFQQWLL